MPGVRLLQRRAATQPGGRVDTVVYNRCAIGDSAGDKPVLNAIGGGTRPIQRSPRRPGYPGAVSPSARRRIAPSRASRRRVDERAATGRQIREPGRSPRPARGGVRSRFGDHDGAAAGSEQSRRGRSARSRRPAHRAPAPARQPRRQQVRDRVVAGLGHRQRRACARRAARSGTKARRAALVRRPCKSAPRSGRQVGAGQDEPRPAGERVSGRAASAASSSGPPTAPPPTDTTTSNRSAAIGQRRCGSGATSPV